MERKALQKVPDHESILELWVRRCLEALGNETPSRMLTRIQKQLLTCSAKCHVGVFSSKDKFTLQVSCNYFLGDSDLLSLTTIKLSYKKLSLGQIYMAMFFFFFPKFNKAKHSSPRISPLLSGSASYSTVLPKSNPVETFFFYQNRAYPLLLATVYVNFPFSVRLQYKRTNCSHNTWHK